MKKEKYTAIVLAAGQGKRMKSKVQKQFLLLDEKPILYYSLSAFERCAEIDEVIIVTGSDNITYCQEEIVAKYHISKVKKIVPGGKERYDSVYEGLKAAKGSDYVLIHDGARPFITQDILKRVIDDVTIHKASVVAMKTKDTIKIAAEDGKVISTPPRNAVWTIQTPQAFAYDLICQAHDTLRQSGMEGVTDDAMVVESVGAGDVWLVEGSYENIKITTPDDLVVGSVILNNMK